MTDVDSGLRDIAAIRSIMERSTKFLSLSGISGIAAGIVALGGAWFARQVLAGRHLELDSTVTDIPSVALNSLMVVGIGTLALGIAVTWFFSRKVMSRKGDREDPQVAHYLLMSLAVPVTVGALMTILLLHHGVLWLLAPSMLLFYGLGLFSAGTFTFGEVRTVGILQILLGLAAAALPAYGLYLWAAGFGLVHIAYGILFFRKYRQ
jgi:hypothetical protein